MIKDIEKNISRCPPAISSSARSSAVPILKQFLTTSYIVSKLNKNLCAMEREVSEFISSNPNIIYCRADKGNVTVALDMAAYVSEINNMLSDVTTYEII